MLCLGPAVCKPPLRIAYALGVQRHSSKLECPTSSGMRALFLCAVALPAGAPLPVVLWHGMGDNCCLPFSMGAIKQEIAKETGAFVHSIRIGNNAAEDEAEAFFGNFTHTQQVGNSETL